MSGIAGKLTGCPAGFLHFLSSSLVQESDTERFCQAAVLPVLGGDNFCAYLLVAFTLVVKKGRWEPLTYGRLKTVSV